LKLVMVRKASRGKTNDAMPAAPDRIALLTFCAVPSLNLEICLPLAPTVASRVHAKQD
jgi:hypothetical protein